MLNYRIIKPLLCIFSNLAGWQPSLGTLHLKSLCTTQYIPCIRYEGSGTIHTMINESFYLRIIIFIALYMHVCIHTNVDEAARNQTYNHPNYIRSHLHLCLLEIHLLYLNHALCKEETSSFTLIACPKIATYAL